MCYDVETSLLAWTLSYTIAWYLFERNRNYDRWIAGFVLCFTTVQLLEAGLWYTLKTRDSDLNNLLTRLLLIILLLQPLVQTYLGYKYTSSGFLGILSYVFLGVLVWGLFKIWRSSKFSSDVGPNGHLVWSQTESNSKQGLINNKLIGALYLFGLFFPLLFMKNYKWIPLVTVGILTALYSLSTTDSGEFSSYWCFTSVIYAVVALFL